MDERLADLCEMCNIYYEGELQQVQDAADQHGLSVALSAMKRLSIIAVSDRKYPIEQFQDVLADKIAWMSREQRHEKEKADLHTSHTAQNP